MAPVSRRTIAVAAATLWLALCAVVAGPAVAQSDEPLAAGPGAGWQVFGAPLPAGVRKLADVPYGSAGRQRIDVYLPPPGTAPASGAPILVMVHGGAWIFGDKSSPGVVGEKLAHWTAHGWILVSVNNRLWPEADPLTQARDVAAAIGLVQKEAASWGGDREAPDPDGPQRRRPSGRAAQRVADARGAIGRRAVGRHRRARQRGDRPDDADAASPRQVLRPGVRHRSRRLARRVADRSPRSRRDADVPGLLDAARRRLLRPDAADSPIAPPPCTSRLRCTRKRSRISRSMPTSGGRAAYTEAVDAFIASVLNAPHYARRRRSVRPAATPASGAGIDAPPGPRPSPRRRSTPPA